MSDKSSGKAAGGSKAALSGAEITGKPTVPEEKTAPDKKGNLIYMGPTIAGVVRHSTVFKDGILTKRIRECVGEMPMMAKLFIEVDRLPDAARELKNRQSVLGAIYAQAARKFTGGK